MTPAEKKTLGLMRSQVGGALAHLSEAVLRLRALENALFDVGTGVVPAVGLEARTAATISSHLAAEGQALGVVHAQIVMVLSLCRVVLGDQ